MYFPMRARFVFLGDDLPMTSSWAGMSRPVATESLESLESRKVGKSEGRKVGRSEGRKVGRSGDVESFLFGRMGVVFVSLGHEETDGTALRFGVMRRWS
jgi:hypothetical protein